MRATRTTTTTTTRIMRSSSSSCLSRLLVTLFVLSFMVSIYCLLFLWNNLFFFLLSNNMKNMTKTRTRKKRISELQYIGERIPLNNAKDGISFDSWNVMSKEQGMSLQSRGRRKLAAEYVEMQMTVADDLWNSMTKSVLTREQSLVGIYALHVSKSGGTSLCDLMKAEKCFYPPDRQGKANCWAYQYRSKSIDLGTQWVRKNYSNRGVTTHFQLPSWMLYDDENTPSSSCNDIRDYLSRYNHMIAMSENWLPNSGVCTNDFLNVIIFRNPLDRLLSHYRHIYNECKHKSGRISCSQMLLAGGEYFDVDFMNETFDIITDNYYTRSLNGQNVYSSPSSLPDYHLDHARENLRDFDWILLLGLEFENSTQEILQEGVGLRTPLPTSRQAGSTKKTIRFRSQDLQRLEKMNKLDFELWEEAKRLHQLDLISIRKMKSASPLEWHERLKITNKNRRHGCCGVVCDNYYESH